MPTRFKHMPTSRKDAKIQLDRRDREGIDTYLQAPPPLSSHATSFHSATLKTCPPIGQLAARSSVDELAMKREKLEARSESER